MVKKLKKKVKELKGITFHSTNPREFVQIDLDYSENEDLFEEDLDFVFIGIEDAIVKVNIKVKAEDLHRVDLNKIKELVKDAYYCKDIVPLIVKQNTVRISQITPDLSAEAAIRGFIDSKKPKRSKQILELSLNLLKEVGVDG